MSIEIDTTNMPRSYTVCYHTACPKADRCLRQLAAPHTPKDQSVVTAVNQTSVLGKEEKCPHFRPYQVVRMAYGMRHIYDQLPAVIKPRVKASVEAAFGHTEYYRYYNQKKPLTPWHQQMVQERFARHGILEPVVFERYADEIDW